MSQPRIIQVPARLEGITRKVDKSVSLRFTTMQEITTEDMTIMDSYFQSEGWLLFRENSFKDEEVPQEDVQVDTEKSQSTQIRDALWVLYRARGGKAADKEGWNRFYKEQQQAFKARILEEVRRLEEDGLKGKS